MQKSFRDFRFVSQFHLAQHMINVHLLNQKKEEEEKRTPKLCFQTFSERPLAVSVKMIHALRFPFKISGGWSALHCH